MSATLKGLVTKAGYMDKTVTVTVSRLVQDRKTRKTLTRSTKFLTHDPQNQLKENDVVVIRQVPPISKNKSHRLDRVIRSPESEALAARAAVLSASASEHAAKSAEVEKHVEEVRKATETTKTVLAAAVWARNEFEKKLVEEKERREKEIVLREGRARSTERD